MVGLVKTAESLIWVTSFGKCLWGKWDNENVEKDKEENVEKIKKEKKEKRKKKERKKERKKEKTD